jgi:ubiquinone/menaquinone biosynthesis C-methylase UbiE
MSGNQEEKFWSKIATTFEADQEWIAGKGLIQAVTEKLHQEHDLGEVIEFGCGTGVFTIPLTQNAKHIIATDLSDEMIEIARTQLEGFQNITVEKANCKNTSFPSERFDTVFMANLIHVIENPQEALQESWRVLRNNGTLLITDGTSYDMRPFAKIKMVIRVIRKWGRPPRYFRGNYSTAELGSLVESAGFKIEEVDLIGDQMKALYLRASKR